MGCDQCGGSDGSDEGTVGRVGPGLSLTLFFLKIQITQFFQVNGVNRGRAHTGRWDMVLGLVAKALQKVVRKDFICSPRSCVCDYSCFILNPPLR